MNHNDLFDKNNVIVSMHFILWNPWSLMGGDSFSG